jgi:predicted NBD/HSP70 family sugar kinase
MSDRQQLTSSMGVAGSLGHFCLSHEGKCIPNHCSVTAVCYRGLCEVGFMSDRQQLTSSLVVAESLGHFCLSHQD